MLVLAGDDRPAQVKELTRIVGDLEDDVE
ncbi:hypothetical protein PSAB6_660004 [Paraburkholderia sabiae]|nr:hypothetical protein PSAB6_660004 [Paraburkholderia sabiae]